MSLESQCCWCLPFLTAQRKAKSEGYFIKCIFVLTIDPLVNVARVEARVASGGHDVDKEKIKSRYYKSLANIKELMTLESSLQSVGRREGVTAGEIDWEVSATEKDG